MEIYRQEHGYTDPVERRKEKQRINVRNYHLRKRLPQDIERAPQVMANLAQKLRAHMRRTAQRLERQLQQDLGIKVCTICGEYKPLEDFRTNSKGRTNAACKACEMEKYIRPYQQQHKERLRPLQREAAKRWREENRQAYREQKRVQKQRRRAMKKEAEGDHTVLEWRALKAKYDYTCLRCRRREPEITLTEDHIQPLSMGGSNYIDNIQPLCHDCNTWKSTQTIDFRPNVEEAEVYSAV